MVVKRALSALSKVAILIAIAVAFIIGLAGTVYLSLRSPEVRVPDVKGKDRMAAEAELDERGLHMRVRATRFSPDAKPDSVLDQSPQKDEVIKVGQTVAVVVARAAKEGETATTTSSSSGNQNENKTGTPENKNANQSSSGNQNENQNRPRRNRNTNKNANNSNTANGNNTNAAAGNRNANGRNANNSNANVPKANGNANRPVNNANANRRPPVISNPTSVPSGTTP